MGPLGTYLGGGASLLEQRNDAVWCYGKAEM